MQVEEEKLHESFMRRALHLAEKSKGFTAPNPMVGAVIVKDGKIVGEGYHRRAGENHAEVNALHRAGIYAQGATVYVTLEPCSHYGKTPPCADALIRAGVKEVYIAITDPNPKVNGGGIKKLEDAGIPVHVGLCGKDAFYLNEVFFTNQKEKRTFIALKSAQSIDGKIGPEDGLPISITSELSRKYCHMLRRQYGAVLVGINTILKDDPRLNIRYDIPHDKNKPIRIIIDSEMRIPLNAKVLDVHDGPILIYTAANLSRSLRGRIESKGVEVVDLPDKNGRVDLAKLPVDLYERGICSVLVEGGSQILTSFFHQGNWDRYYSFTAPVLIGNQGIPVFGTCDRPPLENLVRDQAKMIDKDILVEYLRKDGFDRCLPELLKKRES